MYFDVLGFEFGGMHDLGLHLLGPYPSVGFAHRGFLLRRCKRQ